MAKYGMAALAAAIWHLSEAAENENRRSSKMYGIATVNEEYHRHGEKLIGGGSTSRS